MATNPNAMKTMETNSIFTNVAETNEGGVFWEGLEKETEMDKLEFTDWHSNKWKPGDKTPAAHPNSR